VFYRLLQRVGYVLHMAQVPYLRALAVQLRRLPLYDLGQDAHQALDFAVGPVPILGRERIQREVLYAALHAGPHDAPDILRARAMPCQSGQSTLARPPPIPIHDDGNVLWRRLYRWSLLHSSQ